MKKKLGIYILAFLAMAFWGMSFVWTKIVIQYYNPLTIIFIRLIASSLLLIGVAYISKIKIIPDRKDFVAFAFLAFLEPFAYFIGETYGLQRVSSSVAAILIATIPIVTPFFAYFVLQERLKPMNLLGIIVSFIGVLILILKPDLSLEFSLSGILLLLLAVVSGAYYTVKLKPIANKYSPISIILIVNIIGSVYFLPFFLYFEFSSFLDVKPNFELISSLAELVIFSSILAFVFFVKVVKEIGPSKTAAFSNLIPVITLIAAWFLLPDEVINMKIIIGIFVVLIGVFISQLKLRKTTK